MFEVNGVYANRKGEYTVLAINRPMMRVRFSDGTEADLKISVQERIWENIATEYEATAVSVTKRKSDPSKATRHCIKVITVPTVDELAFPGWTERLILGSLPDGNVELRSGDRLALYCLDSRTFFAVATITSDPKKSDPKAYFFPVNMKKALFYPVDIDAAVQKLDKGVDADTMELESQPGFRQLQLAPESFLDINEDDFELLAEAVAELTEDEEEEEDNADVDDEFDEDDEV